MHEDYSDEESEDEEESEDDESVSDDSGSEGTDSEDEEEPAYLDHGYNEDQQGIEKNGWESDSDYATLSLQVEINVLHTHLVVRVFFWIINNFAWWSPEGRNCYLLRH